MDITPEAATLRMIAKDFYFPVKIPKARRPRMWNVIYADRIGQKTIFPLCQ